MFGLEEFKNVFGAYTIGFIVEVAIAVAGIFIAYKKLENKIIGSHTDRQQQKDDIKKALDGVKENKESQEQLKSADEKILETCEKIQEGVNENQKILNKRLDRIEDRERNALNAKILDMHRLFTSKKKNPLQAWTEMERSAFNNLIKDYESLNGNGYVHTVVIPEMNTLKVILMNDLDAVAELFHSREV